HRHPAAVDRRGCADRLPGRRGRDLRVRRRRHLDDPAVGHADDRRPVRRRVGAVAGRQRVAAHRGADSVSLTPLGLYASQGAGGAPSATPPTVGGYTSGSSNSAAVSLTTPTCAVGDLLVACWALENTTRTPQLPTNWNWLYQGDSTNMRYRVLTKTADSA